MTTRVNEYKTSGGVAAGTYTLGFTPTVGNTLVLCGHMTAASNTLTGATLGSGRAFTQHDTVADAVTSENVYCLSRVVQSGDASSVTFTTSAGNMFFYVLELSGNVTPEAAGFEAATHVANGNSTVHSSNFAAANSNDFALVLNRYSGAVGTISAVTSGYTQLLNGRANTDFFYSLDIGAAGAKNFSWTSGSVNNTAHIYAFKSAVTDPTVSTITGTTVTEGGNIVFTVTLSGPTTRSTTYPALFGGTATGADYNNALGSATYSAGVTASGSDLVVPSGVSSFTVTIATTQDALDEDNETLVLRVGGVDSTGGTITDDDATPAIVIPGPATVDGGDSVVLHYSIPVVSGRVTQARLVLTDGTAVGGTDYTNVITDPMLSDNVTISAGVLSIPAGVASFTITIPTAG